MFSYLRAMVRCKKYLLSAIYLSCMLMLCSSLETCPQADFVGSISSGNFINNSNNGILVSSGRKFEMGFFSPKGGSDPGSYIGIWYYMSNPKVVVWVANNGKPLEGFGSFGIAHDGNLVVLDHNASPCCFSTSLAPSSSHRIAILFDSGNLGLRDDISGKVLWESFSHPTDTFLPGMKMDVNGILKLTSWKSQDNPAPGSYVFKLDDQGSPIIQNGSSTYWESAESSKFTDSQLPFRVGFLLSNFTATGGKTNNSRNLTIPDPIDTISDYIDTRLVLNSSGRIQWWNMSLTIKNYSDLIWSAPVDQCSIYKFCGNYGSCNNNNTVKCRCLPGFDAIVSEDQIMSGDFSSGCNRKSRICTQDDIFLKLKRMKVSDPDPNFDGTGFSSEDCENECRANCQCLAYSFVENYQRGRGEQQCWIWNSDLYNLEENYGFRDLYVRVAASDIRSNNTVNSESNSARRKSAIVTAGVIAAVLIAVSLIGTFVYYLYKRRSRTSRRGSKESIPSNQAMHLYNAEKQARTFIDSGDFKEDDKKGIDVPFLKLETILEATDYFSDANKLGEGGFGPVYKGIFYGEREMAVKRLSSHSRQGLEEFKNEVILIAKLQHRNLVRLLGYCIQGEEKILLYEYMLNKSLDAFIFDRALCMLLHWEKRFDIILGIARGLLYLHQDSRLRVIHRDLKTSNILLDEEMNPKISDFGLARIVGGNETKANTTRVVGTYGYMSPEYALEGLFSTKSDVFSFGVILLEIVSGRRNTGFYQSELALSLLGYAWRLWGEEKALNLLDPNLSLSNKSDGVILRCITVGLLCVQEDPSDRPNMSNALFMLGNEAATLPIPKQPAFVAKKWIAPSSSSATESCSNAGFTISSASGR